MYQKFFLTKYPNRKIIVGTNGGNFPYILLYDIK